MSQTWFVSRHPGAIEWAQRQGIAVQHWVKHLALERVGDGDLVIGTLPIHLVAQICAVGAQYLHLSLDLPPDWRGRELTADELTQCGARLEAYRSYRDDASPITKSLNQ